MEKVEVPERLLRSADVGMDYAGEPPPVYPMALSMSRMVACIHGGGLATPDFERAWVVECALEAARKSNVERRWVEVDGH